MNSYIATNLVYNELEYFCYLNHWLLFIFFFIVTFYSILKITTLYFNKIYYNDTFIEFVCTLFSLLFLLFIISPALIILLVYLLLILCIIELYYLFYHLSLHVLDFHYICIFKYIYHLLLFRTSMNVIIILLRYRYINI